MDSRRARHAKQRNGIRTQQCAVATRLRRWRGLGSCHERDAVGILSAIWRQEDVGRLLFCHEGASEIYVDVADTGRNYVSEKDQREFHSAELLVQLGRLVPTLRTAER